MGTDDFRFLDAAPDQQRRAVAQTIGCAPDQPAGWPNDIIDRLIDLRKTEGAKAYFEEVGRLLGPR